MWDRHYIQTLSTGVFSILHAGQTLLRVEFGEEHLLLIDIQAMNPRKSSTFLSLFLKQQSIKVVKPSSVSPLLVKKKPYVLFSSKCGVRCRLYFYVTLWSIDRILSRIAKNWIDVQTKQFLFESNENIPLRPFKRKAIQKTLKNSNANRKISRKIARKLLSLLFNGAV